MQAVGVQTSPRLRLRLPRRARKTPGPSRHTMPMPTDAAGAHPYDPRRRESNAKHGVCAGAAASRSELRIAATGWSAQEPARLTDTVSAVNKTVGAKETAAHSASKVIALTPFRVHGSPIPEPNRSFRAALRLFAAPAKGVDRDRIRQRGGSNHPPHPHRDTGSPARIQGEYAFEQSAYPIVLRLANVAVS